MNTELGRVGVYAFGTAERTPTLAHVAVGIGAGRFLWEDYRGLFVKAEREQASLRISMDHDVLFNYLCTVTHICDWIRNDPRVKGIPAIEADADRIRRDPEAHAIRELCNGAKHLDLTGRALPPVLVSYKSWAERLITSVRRSRRMPLNEGETKVLVTVDGVARDVLDVAQSVLTKWRGLLTMHGLPVPP
jgi:hypothetical protein